MIKSFFFSTNIVPPFTTFVWLFGRTPSPIDRHAEEITLIAGITSPTCWLATYSLGEEGRASDGARCA